MVKASKESLKKQLERAKKEIKKLKSGAEHIDKALGNMPNIRQVTHGVGFVAIAWIIKEGVFNPFSALLKALDIVETPTAEEAPLTTFLDLPFGIGKRIDKLTKDITESPLIIGERIGKGVVDGYERDLERWLQQQLDQATGRTEPTEEEKANIMRPWITRAEAQKQFAGWMFGFAGAWAFGKFLSETTWTEIVETFPVIQ